MIQAEAVTEFMRHSTQEAFSDDDAWAIGKSPSTDTRLV